MNVPQDLAAPTTEGLAKKSSKKLSPLQLKALQALEQFEANVCVPRLSSPAHFSHSRAGRGGRVPEADNDQAAGEPLWQRVSHG